MPAGALDVYEDPKAPLGQYKPRRPPMEKGNIEVYAIPLKLADEDLRKSAEAVLHLAWNYDKEAKSAISYLMGLGLKGINLRSGKQTSRCEAQKKDKGGHWLIWEEAASPDITPPRDARAVGALLLRRQGVGNSGGIVIDYISARRSRAGRGWPMVLAAEAVCRKEGLRTLYSAADLTQDGCGCDPEDGRKGCSAIDAHHRWEFRESSAEEWRAVGLDLYDENKCSVAYLKKPVAPP